MDGNDFKMEYCRLQLGKSNLELNGKINNVPAIIHQTNGEVVSEIHVKSKLLDFKELTSFDTIKQKPFDEKIRNLKGKIPKIPLQNIEKFRKIPLQKLKILREKRAKSPLKILVKILPSDRKTF